MLLRSGIIWAILFPVISLSPADEQPPTHAADPAELRAAIGRADKVVVYDSTPAINIPGIAGTNVGPRILYSSVDPKDISALRESIAVERPKSWFRFACLPYIDIVLSWKGKELGVISISEDLTIGFSHWSGDARVADQTKLVKWFEARGVSSPGQKLKEMQEQERTDRADEERWISAMPASLRPLWPKLMQDAEWWSLTTQGIANSANSLKPALAKQFPDVRERIRALFSWFGSGAGPWSGYPAYEDVAPRLLLEYQASELISAIQDAPLTESEMEGAARFFSGYCYGHAYCPPEDSTLIPLIPIEIKKSLLVHVLKSPDQDKVERARRAFGQK
jgi:hypothetical protein